MAERQNGRMEEWRNGGIAKNGTYLPHLWYTPTLTMMTPTPFNHL
jgi:hypothetical protein